MSNALDAVRERLTKRFRNTPRPDYSAKPVPASVVPCAVMEFSELTDEIKAQQEADRIKFNLPF